MLRRTILCTVLFVITITVYAQKKTYTSQRIIETAPRIDGIIDETVWDQVEWAGDFVQNEPHAGAPASQKTEFKVVYDDDNIYFAIRCHDTAPDSIVRRMSRRDGDEGDWVKITIDSYHDLLTAFSFGVSAAGVKIDEAVTGGANWDTSWDPIWDVKTGIDDKGWTVEARIPISQLRFSKKEEYVWGLELGRRLYRKEELSLWQFISPTAPAHVHLFGELHGIKNIKPKKQKDLTPYIATGVKTYKAEEGNPFSDGQDLIFHAGLDGKVGITNNLTLDFSINPDFGQVEADPSEVNLTTFETKFNEKRPFFIEGRNILSFNVLNGGGPLASDNLFYSRRIGKSPSYWPDPDSDNGEYGDGPDNTSILAAFKLTGKTEKGWSIGIMESVTQKETAKIDWGNEEDYESVIVEPLSNYFVSRVQRDLNKSNTQIGAIFTATNRNLTEPELKEFMHKQAYSAGVDLFHQWKDKTYYINIIAAASRVIGTEDAIYNTQTSPPHYFQRPGQTHMKHDSTLKQLDGFGATFQIGRAGNGKWMYTFWVTARSPGFNLNDLGYSARADEIQQIFWVGFRQREPFSIFRNLNLNINQWSATSFGMEKRYFGGNVDGQCTFKNYWRLGLGVDRDGSGLGTDILRGGPALVYDGSTNFNTYLSTDERKKIQLSYGFFTHRGDHNISKSLNHSLNMRIRISDAWSLSLNPRYSINSSKLEYVDTPEDTEEARYICGTLNQTTAQLVFRSDYSITPELTVQLYCMPFVSAGNYTDFKYITDADAKDFSDRFSVFSDNQISYNSVDEIYEINEDTEPGPDYDFNQPNFNVFDLNLNMVVRWEYQPGSTVYLVWSQNRNEYSSAGEFQLADNTDTLFGHTNPTNVVLLKWSHRFGL